MGSNFALLEKHLESDLRRRQLLEIEGRLKEHAYPPQVVIENTSICNLTCIHCSHRELQRTRRHMKRPLWNKIVEEFGANAPDTEIWPTFYGEALIMGYKSELWDRLDYADKVGCRNLVLNSNGTLLDRWDNIDKILASPLRRFIFSLDGLSKETFELIREKAKWEEVYPAGRGAVPPPPGARAEVSDDHRAVLGHEAERARGRGLPRLLGSARRRGEGAADAGVDGDRHGAHRHHHARHRFPHRLPVGQQHHGHPPGRLGGRLRGRLRGQVQGRQRQRDHRQGSLATARRAAAQGRTASIAGTTSRTSAKAAATGRSPAPNTRKKQVEGTRPFWYYDEEKRARRSADAERRSPCTHEPDGHQDRSTAAEQYGLRPEASEFPMMLVLSFVYPCNALCPHCPYTNSNIRKEYRDAPYMPEATVQEDRRRIRAATAPICASPGGGEPMLHPQATSFWSMPRKSAARSA